MHCSTAKGLGNKSLITKRIFKQDVHVSFCCYQYASCSLQENDKTLVLTDKHELPKKHLAKQKNRI